MFNKTLSSLLVKNHLLQGSIYFLHFAPIYFISCADFEYISLSVVVLNNKSEPL